MPFYSQFTSALTFYKKKILDVQAPIHAACAQGDVNAVREMWEGVGRQVVFLGPMNVPIALVILVQFS